MVSTANTRDQRMSVGKGFKSYMAPFNLYSIKWKGCISKSEREKQRRRKLKGRHLLHSTDQILGRLADLPSNRRHSTPGCEEGCAGSWVPIHFHCVTGLHRATRLVVQNEINHKNVQSLQKKRTLAY